jgi:hypothetical protein
MSKVRNYINYIADDILKNDIKIDGDRIIFPWVMEDIIAHHNGPGRELVFYKHTATELIPWVDKNGWYPNDMTIFKEYVKSKYGAKDSEVNRVWRRVSDLLYDLAPTIKNR